MKTKTSTSKMILTTVSLLLLIGTLGVTLNASTTLNVNNPSDDISNPNNTLALSSPTLSTDTSDYVVDYDTVITITGNSKTVTIKKTVSMNVDNKKQTHSTSTTKKTSERTYTTVKPQVSCTNTKKRNKSEITVKTGNKTQTIKSSDAFGSSIYISKIETNDEHLIITLTPKFGRSMHITEQARLQSKDDGGRRYFIIKKEEVIVKNTEGENTVSQKLYFRKFAEEISSFDLIKCGYGIEFYDIEVTEDNDKMVIWHTPQEYKEPDRVITKPEYAAKSGHDEVTKIEFGENYTAISFKIKGIKCGQYIVPTNTCIYDSEGGNKLYVRATKNIELGQWTNAKELKEFTLYFPALDSKVKTINLKENNIGGTLIIHGLKLR